LVAEQVILGRLGHLRTVVEELRRVRPRDLDAMLRPEQTAARRATERCLYLAIQDVLDIANHIVSAEGWGYPETYREAVQALAERGVVPPDFGTTLVAMAGFRNILEHEYVRLDAERLFAYSRSEADFEQFAGYVLAFLESE